METDRLCRICRIHGAVRLAGIIALLILNTGLAVTGALAAASSRAGSAFEQSQGIFAHFTCSYPKFARLQRPEPAHPWTKWGLGLVENEYVSNDRGYEWYINQNQTGKYGFENCGPASATMACMWSDPFFSRTTEEARAAYHPDGGWWYMDDISSYLELNGIPCRETANRGNQSIMEELRQGYIVIINIDLRELSYNPNDTQRVDKFYSGGTGHFIILKGFALVDNRVFFECYDPATQNHYYSFERYTTSSEPMGKDRYYRGEEIQRAMYNWYNNYLVVEPLY